ncbi:MAG: prolyl oligopeptidase family serine peptidase [Phycisphaerales bacterium]|nr:MAG: prolyl oligopeptidase family serine peptidase [Phycisphaerales bacterium]
MLSNWLVIEPVGRYGRAAVHTDAIEARIVAGRWSAPKTGDTVALPDGAKRSWQTAAPAEDGWLDHAALRGGYAFASTTVDAARVMLLDASGHSTVYVNGQPRAGDPYRTGWVRLPVMLQPGTNTFLFHCSRGRVRAKLVDPRSNLVLNPSDATLPDLIVGESVNTWAAIPVINATTEPVANLQIKASYDGGETTVNPAPVIPALSLRKVGFRLAGPAPTKSGPVDVQLDMFSSDQPAARLDTLKIALAARDVGDRYKQTFVSKIDGSVQYYAVTPARPPAEDVARPALFLTLHGAGVEATGQAAAYQSKDWGHVVAPTNRRPFGFDWEDWGRLDAMEVVALAAQELNTDPRRTYLTGHSMGGHGVWHVGATFPDRFAAIAPSAGWISFWSYAGAHKYEGKSPVERLLRRATTPSDTLALSRNYLHHGVYILHGERDDNVPVDQARKMRAHLGTYHCDFAYYEKPEAGHWWTNTCVDWPPLFDFLRRHANPAPHDVRHVEFATANPAVSATSRWAAIEAQIHPLDVSSVKLGLDVKTRKLSGTTDNVARLALDLSELSRPRHGDVDGEQTDATVLPAGDALTVELDGTTLENIPWPEPEPRLWLTHVGDAWTVSGKPSPSLKGPHRYGPFKQVFRNRFRLVYGTKGSARQNAWSFSKARYDAETFWYRGNGAVDVIADTEFNPDKDRDSNVILYGNASSNRAWAALLADSPVQVRPGGITIGRRELPGDDLACLTIRPRPGSDRALVGAVAGTGSAGMRLTDRLPYFVSGVAYPDCIVLGPDVLTDGGRGVRVAGYFGIDWTIDSGDFAWRDQ